MPKSLRIQVSDESQVGQVRRAVIERCRRQGAAETLSSEAAIVATEMARNLVRHGNGGDFILRELPNSKAASLDLLAIDRGPGMRNLAECMRDGHSTIGTAGQGLGAIQRLSSQAEFFSQPGKGTVVWARICSQDAPGPSAAFQIGAVSVPISSEEVCGDSWEAVEGAQTLRILVADGLGHGPFAEQASRAAVAAFRAHSASPLPEILESAHRELTGTRGAAAAIVELNPGQSAAVSVGIGNISMRLIHEDETSKSFICENGTLGATIRKVLSYAHPWRKGAILVMHSDGLSTNWDLSKYPGLSKRHPSVVAAILYRDFRRERDDATVVVARHVG